MSETETEPGPPRAKLPARPAPETPPLLKPVAKKYVPVDNSKFTAYALTNAMNNYDQMRKHGHRDR